MATAKKPEKFQPHDYATTLIRSQNWRSDRHMLYNWTGSHWSIIESREASEAAAYRWLVDKQAANISPENATRAVRAALLFLPPLDDVDKKGVVIVPCRNGYVHLSTIPGADPELRPAEKTLNIRHSLAVEFDASAKSAPVFEKFITRALPIDEVRARVQEYIGYTLLADARFQRAQLWLGDGANGKGVLANIVQQLHGVVAAIRLDDLDGFRLASLVGASLVYCDEAPRGRFNEQLVKSLIGGETVSVNRKYLSSVSLRLQGKWIVLGNHIPTITDHSAGFWRRWDLVPFGNTVPDRERDPLLLEKILLNEMPAILNWALVGLQRVLARGNFDPRLPSPMAVLLNSARSDSNSIQAWLQNVNLALAPSGTVSRKTRLYAHYRTWCEDNGLQAFSSTKWLQFLEAYFPNRLVLKRQRGSGDKNPDWYLNLIYEDFGPSVTADLTF